MMINIRCNSYILSCSIIKFTLDFIKKNANFANDGYTSLKTDVYPKVVPNLSKRTVKSKS